MATNTELKATLTALVAILPEALKDYGAKLQKRLQKAIDNGDKMTKDAIRVEIEARLEQIAVDRAAGLGEAALKGFLKLLV